MNYYVSVYLSTKPEDRGDKPPRYEIKLKDLIKAEEEFRRKHGIDIEQFQEDFNRIRDFVFDPANLESDNGLPVWGIGIFSNAKEGYFEVKKLPFIYREMLEIDRTPYIRAALEIESEFGRNLIVHFSRKWIRFYIASIQEGFKQLGEEISIEGKEIQEGVYKTSLKAGITISRTIGGQNLENIIEERDRKILRIVSSEIFEVYKRTPVDNIYIAGPDKLDHMLLDYLHSYVKQRLRAILKLPSNPSKNQIVETLLRKIEELDYRDERNKLEELEFALSKGMGAVNNLKKIIENALMANIKLLIVDKDYQKEGFVCYPSGYISFGEEECLFEEDEKWPVKDIVDTLIEQVISTGGHIEIAHFEELRKAIYKGVGAIFRYSI